MLAVIMAILVLSTACVGRNPAAPLVTPPAISVQVTEDYCPSIELQTGMNVAWTNQDNADRAIILGRLDEQGVFAESGGTDLLRPGDTFSTQFNEPGRYAYYCSVDRSTFGTITVLPVSYPYP